MLPPHTRAQWVDDRLREEILLGRLQPGERVAVERLASDWGVSATPIRESLRRLAGEGLVTLLPQRGARVSSVDAQLAADIYSVRITLEPMALRQSMLAAVDDHSAFADEVGIARDQLLGPHASAVDVYRDHRRFHRVLLSRCPNRVLIEQIESLTDRARLFQILGSAPLRGGSHRNEHATIAGHVMSRDVDGAVEALTSHLMLTLDVVRRMVESRDNN